MKRLSRGSVSTSPDPPLGFAMVDTFRFVVLLVMTLPLLQKLGYCSVHDDGLSADVDGSGATRPV
jgi:hypothetical protein